MSDDDLTIGRIGPARGVRGDVFVQPWTDAPEERFAVGTAVRTDPAGAGPLTVESMAFAGGKLVVRFAGVEDRAAAQALRGTRLVIGAHERPPLEDPEEFYDSDLIGLAARTVDGTALGPVVDVLHAGAATYLVLEVAGAQRLVPFVAAVVPSVDVRGGTVAIDPPSGLLTL